MYDSILEKMTQKTISKPRRKKFFNRAMGLTFAALIGVGVTTTNKSYAQTLEQHTTFTQTADKESFRPELNVYDVKIPGFGPNAPLFKGGLGEIIDNSANNIGYASGVLKIPKLNHSVLLFNFDDGKSAEWEFKAKANLPYGFSLNAGHTERRKGIDDTTFAGVMYRLGLSNNFNALLRGAASDFNGGFSPELALILDYVGENGKNASIGINVSDEQIRAAFGYRNPKGLGLDFLVIDSRIGEDGPLSYMANWTLKANHGFTSNVSRDCRILGVTGTCYENPVSDLVNFRRLAHPWDFGDVLNLRYRGLHKPNGSKEGRLDLVLFPFQWFDSNYIPDNFQGFFIGPIYNWVDVPNKSAEQELGLLGGIKLLNFDKFKLTVAYQGPDIFSHGNQHTGIVYFTIPIRKN